MKIERVEVVPVFEPITITIESVEELKWLVAIANSSETKAIELANNLGFEIDDKGLAQMSLWNGISKYLDIVQ